jgi:heat-inducible transcriptional repressor
MERERLILKEIVETHIDSGEAVGSRAIAMRLGHALSAASIRAVMHELGQRGWLAQPHTSAGRVPTDLGWRIYLDEMLVRTSLKAEDRRRIEAIAWTEGMPASDVLREAARATAKELGVATAVVLPRFETQVLQRLELVWLRPGRVLALAVTSGGLVHERLVHVEAHVGRPELERFSNYLNSILPGHSLHAVRRMLEDAQRHAAEEIERQAASLGQRAFDHSEPPEVMVEGASRVLAQREFTESPERGPDLLRTLEQRSVWLDLIEQLVVAPDVRVYVGHETGHDGLGACAVVATRYGAGRGEGIIAIVGPKRIDYRRVLPWVRLLGSRLGQVLDAAG